MNDQLQLSEFLYKVEVLTALGSAEEYKNWLKDVKHTLRSKRDTVFPIQKNDKKGILSFANLMSFLRPIPKDLINPRVPIHSILSEIVIQHIIDFPDEKIEEMEDNERTVQWGNALEMEYLGDYSWAERE